MRKSLPLGALLFLPYFAAANTSKAPPSLGEPALSPDRTEIAFVSGGDIWTVSAKGGEARLLVSDPATESRPLDSPDATKLAFTSTRTGNGDVYVLTFATGALARLTYSDAPGHVVSLPLESHVPNAVAVTAAVDVDFETDKMAVFEQGWALFNKHFFNDDFNGHDWSTCVNFMRLTSPAPARRTRCAG